MESVKVLKRGSRGPDVRVAKVKLFQLGYYDDSVKTITHDRFGGDTERAVMAFQKAHGLDADGIIGEQTRVALFPEEARVLRYLMAGEDVRQMKEKLFFLGFYEKKITRITNDCFGSDTKKAVKAFQTAYHLNADGIFGKNTRKKLEEVFSGKTTEPEMILKQEDYPRIGRRAFESITAALGEVAEERKKMVTEALKYATDASIAEQFAYPSSLYIRGGNLYGKDLTENIITEDYLKKTYSRKYSGYVTNGRLEMMTAAVRQAAAEGKILTGADCSGGIVGLMRFFGFVKSDFDDTANGLCGGHSAVIQKTDLLPGDFVGRSGHICLYAGGGYLIEWVGGEFGCQLTNMNDHKAWSFTKKKLIRQSSCGKYRRPKFY